MSQLSRAVLGTIAVSLTLGAVQLAAGRDLTGTQNPAGTPDGVNRAATCWQTGALDLAHEQSPWRPVIMF